MKIVTFNQRYFTDDGINHLYSRIGMIRQKIKAALPDVIGFQEVTDVSREALMEILPEYHLLGSWHTGDSDGEEICTAVRRDKYEVMGLESIWLSPTPYGMNTRFENQSGVVRLCVMLYLRDKKTNFRFRVFNTHLDHVSDEARVLGMQAVLDFVDLYQKKEVLPAFIMGDMNAEPDSKTMALADARADLFEVTKPLEATFHRWGRDALKIDYIYATNDMKDKLTKVEIWPEEHDGIYLSDHYPISAEFHV